MKQFPTYLALRKRVQEHLALLIWIAVDVSPMNFEIQFSFLGWHGVVGLVVAPAHMIRTP